VYDCGTSSSQTQLRQRILELPLYGERRDRLGLVTISHFDNDHVSGIPTLLSNFAVDTLLLPYIPLWKRLLLAFKEGVGPGDEPMGFFVNPAAYLTAIPGSDITRIVFVSTGGQAEPTQPGGPPGPPQVLHDTLHIQFDSDHPHDPADLPFPTGAAAKTQVAFLKGGGTLRIPGFWEFVPYNDEVEVEMEHTFQTAVDASRQRLLTTAAPEERGTALAELKQLYDDQFGNTSEERNAISLFLYAGPVYPAWDLTRPLAAVVWRPDFPNPHIGLRTVARLRRGPLPQCSILYAGDGYLDMPDRLARMAGFFGRLRIERLGAFQVMHHGARGNWHKGVAQALAPEFSIFSSDPNHKRLRHPHPPVLRDFWGYSPIQVDSQQGASLSGYMAHPR
jgi:hypothetical protein